MAAHPTHLTSVVSQGGGMMLEAGLVAMVIPVCQLFLHSPPCIVVGGACVSCDMMVVA